MEYLILFFSQSFKFELGTQNKTDTHILYFVSNYQNKKGETAKRWTAAHKKNKLSWMCLWGYWVIKFISQNWVVVASILMNDQVNTCSFVP